MRHVYIALPAYNGAVRVETTACLVDAVAEFNRLGWRYKLQISVGDSILPRCRNKFIADALADPQITDLVFLDHDIAWGANALPKLLSHHVDLVAGVYPKREDPISFPVRFLDGEIRRCPTTGLVPVDGVPAGFLRITTRALRRMVQHYYHLRYDEKGVPGDVAWSLFDFQMVGGKYWGEDFVFCRRFRDMGGEILVDPDLEFAHIGHKPFQGSLAKWLDDRADAREAETAAATNVKPIVRVPANSAAA
jgi:hypothetical protein